MKDDNETTRMSFEEASRLAYRESAELTEYMRQVDMQDARDDPKIAEAVGRHDYNLEIQDRAKRFLRLWNSQGLIEP